MEQGTESILQGIIRELHNLPNEDISVVGMCARPWFSIACYEVLKGLEGADFYQEDELIKYINQALAGMSRIYSP
jgi:hypothetical protein